MNSCAYYQELISSLVDGELSDEENEALMLHLNSCSRCNAMYAVFHDLSDILSEEPEPLPEGLHENIMAGVRRSEIIKRSRRMRKIGLRTAMTAAACAVLVLFAAAGFNPGKRADSVSIRSEQEASQLLPAPSPAAGTPAVEQAAPASAPVSVQTPAPAQTPAPVYDTESAAAYTPVQPEQSYNDSYDSYQETAPLPAWTPAQPSAPVWTPAQPSVPAQTPAPVYDTDSAAAYTAPLWTPETPAPATPIPATPAPVWTSAPVPAAAPAEAETTTLEMSDLTTFEAAPPEEAPDALTTQNTVMQARAADPAPTQDPEDAADYGTNETETDEEPVTFSLFSGMMDLFDAAPPEQLADSKLSAPDGADTGLDALSLGESAESPAPVLSGMPLELSDMSVFAAPSPTPVPEERVTVYGSESRAKLLAMIGSSEDTLPQEAELTRLVHVSFRPDDAYGSEEKMDISIYGDFVYCSLYPVEGGSVTYRADCSLKELDSFLDACLAAPVPSAAPTPDPFIAETPAPTPVEAPSEAAPAA